MNKQLQHGHIGSKEIKEAIEIFKNKYISDKTGEIVYDDKSIYIQRMNKCVVGQEFDDIEELLSNSEFYLSTYTSIEDYKEQMLDLDEDYIFSEDKSEIKEALEDGTVIYVVTDGVNNYISDDKTIAILEAICDGDQFCYTLDEAFENLNSRFTDESLVIWLLQQ